MSNISNIELEFNEYISSLGYEYERNNRNILKHFVVSQDCFSELDFWFPVQNIAIEFDGDFYHNNGYYNKSEFVLSCCNNPFMKHLLHEERTNARAIIKFAYSYTAKIFIYHVYEFEWRNEITRNKIKKEIKELLENKQNINSKKSKIIIDAGKENYLSFMSLGYKIKKYNKPTQIAQQGKLKIYNCGTLIMEKSEL